MDPEPHPEMGRRYPTTIVHPSTLGVRGADDTASTVGHDDGAMLLPTAAGSTSGGPKGR